MDKIEPDEVSYYINSRRDRKEYLSYIPTLVTLKEITLKWKALEAKIIREVLALSNASESELLDALRAYRR